MSFAEWVDLFRDIFISLFFLMGIVLMLVLVLASFLLFLAVRGLVRKASKAVDNVSEVSEAAKERIVTPLGEGASLTNVVGNSLGFVTGFLAGMRGKRSGGKDEGKKK